MPKKSKLKFFWVPDELWSQIVLRIYSESQIFRIFWPIWVSRSLAQDMGNRVTPIWAIFKQFFAQIGFTRLPISRARDLETQIGRKILKILDSDLILRTIWLPNSSGTQKNLSFLFFGIKAQLKGCFMYCKTAKLRRVASMFKYYRKDPPSRLCGVLMSPLDWAEKKVNFFWPQSGGPLSMS